MKKFLLFLSLHVLTMFVVTALYQIATGEQILDKVYVFIVYTIASLFLSNALSEKLTE